MPSDKNRMWRRFTSDISILLYIAAATAVIHLLTSGNYGYFNDELYTLACSRHVSLAFVDIPPVAPALLALETALFGDSLTAIHILPALFCGAMVVLVGLMAGEMGGGRAAVLLAGLCAAFVPTWMVVGSMYTYDFLDQLTVVSLFYAFVRLLKHGNPKTWLAIGVIAGIGVMVKPSMLFFVAGIAVALLFTKQRKQYLTPWPWLGALAAFAVILPALIWQILNGFPLAEYWAGYTQSQVMQSSALEFVMMQVLGMNFILLPVWALGLCYFFFSREGRRYILLGAIFCVLLALFLVMNVKVYMPIPLYAMLLAGGSVAIERFAKAKRSRRVIMPAFACLLVAAGVLQAPLFMPILPVEKLAGYMEKAGNAFGVSSVKITNGNQAGVPVYFVQRFDWDVVAADVAEVYGSLPEAERANATIASEDYGCAGAVDLFGGKLGLPKAACGRLNYYYFSRDNIRDGTWIALGIDGYMLYQNFGDVKLAKLSTSKHRQPARIAIYICRDPKFTAEEMREQIRVVK
jgi:hypothetical protein